MADEGEVGSYLVLPSRKGMRLDQREPPASFENPDRSRAGLPPQRVRPYPARSEPPERRRDRAFIDASQSRGMISLRDAPGLEGDGKRPVDLRRPGEEDHSARAPVEPVDYEEPRSEHLLEDRMQVARRACTVRDGCDTPGLADRDDPVPVRKDPDACWDRRSRSPLPFRRIRIWTQPLFHCRIISART